jgi:excisionase family DNA binding protein
MTLSDSRDVLTVAEAADLLRLGRNSTYAAIQRGELPARRVGRRWLISKDALERFLAGESADSMTGRNGNAKI